MKVGIIGLGLIGGSFARTIKELTDHTVYGCDTDASAVYAAKLCNAIDAELTDSELSAMDLVIVALPPAAARAFLSEKQSLFGANTTVVDTVGVKRAICDAGFALARKNGFYFLGGHPMAGIQYSGFGNSRSDLFSHATMLLCADGEDYAKMERVRDFFYALGFSAVRFVSPEVHDRMIAFTSQLAHVVSNAYVKSPRAQMHLDYAAGSYQDMTRVARLDPQLWTQLFLDNRDNLLAELDTIIENLGQYRAALAEEDAARLFSLLKEGSDRKIETERTAKRS